MNAMSDSHDQSLLARLQRDPARACVLIFSLMGMVAYAPLLMTLAEGMMDPGIPSTVSNRDFANYWMGARLTLTGEHLELFSQPVYFTHMREMFGPTYPIHNWGYPPHFLLLLWPLGLLEYKSAMVVFLVSTLVLFAASAITFRRVYAPQSNPTVLLLAAVGYAVMMLDTTQNGFLTAAALLFGLAWMKQRPVLAGIAFAVLTVKPQLGFLVPLLLVIDRNWKAFAWSSLFSTGFIALSIAVLGFESWYAYATETIPYQRSVMTDWYGIFLPMMPTVFGSIRTLGFAPETAWLIQWPVTIASSVLVVWLLLKENDPLRKTFILALGTFLISPYAFNYDMGALTITGAVLAGAQRGRPRPMLVTIGISAALAPAVMNLGRAGVPLAPVVLASTLVGLAITMPGRRSAASAGIDADSSIPG